MSLDARRNREVWVDPRTWRVQATAAQGAATGSVLRIGPARIEAVFSPSPALPAVGRTVDLAVSNESRAHEAIRHGIVADRVDVAGDLLMFGFDLRPGPDDRGDLSLSERRAVRIPIPDERPLRAVIRHSAGEARGKVSDLSITGLSLICPASAERQLAAATGVEVRFLDATALGDRPIAARIQHRRFDGDKSVVYGLEFGGGAVAHLQAVIARLERSHVRMR